ncbi:unnamed protein product [Rhodiola kirilowii]
MPDVTSTKIRGKMDDASIGMREPKRRSKSLSASNIFEPDVPESSSAKIDGRKEGTSTKMLEPARRSKSSSDDSSGSESSDEKVTSVRKFFGNSSGKAPPIKKKISFADDLMNPKEAKETEAGITTKPSWKKRASFTDDKPSLKKPPTFADNTLDSIEAQRPVTAGLKPGKGFPIETALRPPPSLAQQTPTRVQGSKADAWERAQMAKIKERYNTVRSTIDSWENKKREAAKRQKEKRERELEQKRARVLQHFRREMESIDAVAKGARAEAEKKKIREELSAALLTINMPEHCSEKSLFISQVGNMGKGARSNQPVYDSLTWREAHQPCRLVILEPDSGANLPSTQVDVHLKGKNLHGD